MVRFVRYSLALQLAIAGVALAENQTVMPGERSGDLTVKSDQKLPVGLIRSSKLIGTEVYNRQGKHLGEVKDVVLDQDQKLIGYAVLSYGGIAGLGDKLFALPHDMIQYSSAESRAYVQLDEQVLRNAPGFDRTKWPSEANADYYKELDAYYSEHRVTADAARPAGERMEDAAERTGEAVKHGAEKAGEAMQDGVRRLDQSMKTRENVAWNRRVSALIGANVENSTGENLGEVKDIVLDWQGGKVRYAVLSYGGILGIGDKLFAVPMESFTVQPDSSKLVLNVNKDQLKNAPGFNQSNWPDMADETWSKSVSDFYQQNRQVQ